MMTKREIADMVKYCVGPIKETVAETKATLDTMSTNMNTMAVAMGRIDERTKIAAGERIHNERSSD